MIPFRAVLPLVLLLGLAPASAQFPGKGGGKVKASLVVEASAVQAGKPFRAGLRLEHAEHWHTYWINPGNVGQPITLDWSLPEGWTAGAPQWPAPGRFALAGMIYFVYEGDTLIPVEITPSASAPAGPARLAAKVAWQECDDESCVQGKAEVSATVEVGASAEPPSAAVAALFARADQALPAAAPAYSFRAAVEGTNLVLRVTGPAGGPAGAYFYPETPDLVNPDLPQAWAATAGGYTLTAPLVEKPEPLPADLRGVLAADTPWPQAGGAKALAVSTASAVAAPPAPAKPAPGDAALPATGFLLYAGAFLGGLLLNLMPCVFPVISLKVMSFVQQAHGDPKAAFRHGLVFSLGVLLSFWAFAAVILALKSGGKAVGWGFQFQDPRMAIGLSFLFLLLALNFFGVFEMGTSLTGVGAEAQAREGYAGSFYSGILAVLVATPCTGPFMGTAIGAAFAQPGAVTLAIFTLLGLGMALPYLVMGARPRLLDFIPRPGEWMNTFKQVLGFLMLGTVVFMYYVLGSLRPPAALVHLTGGLVLAGLAAWIYGKWGEAARPARTRRIAAVLALLTLAGAVKAALSFPEAAGLASLKPEAIAAIKARGYFRHEDLAADARAAMEREGAVELWAPWSADRVAEARRAGRPVFVDFTASWCAICQVNKKSTLRRPEVEKALAERKALALLADFSSEDPAVLAELEKHGRAGVPLYLLYGPDAGAPQVLPNTLTPGLVLEALRKL